MAPRSETLRETVDALYRTESRRILATLIRLLGDFELAEEALQDAFANALVQWERDGIPENPRAWLISTGRFKAIDAVRRRGRFDRSLPAIAERLDNDARDAFDLDDQTIKDDTLRLVFTCCHPALPADARIPLTLREVCGLTTEEIARAFLSKPTAIAQRIVRAKAKIRDAGIPYKVPDAEDLNDRIEAVLHVVYLVFNEGYSASFGDSIIRKELTGEAIRLGRLLAQLLPEPEVEGLLALMLLQESRSAARSSESGDLILLEDQDRSLWNHEQIREGCAIVQRVLNAGRFGAYTVQAAIAAVHGEAKDSKATDWTQIAALYDVLLRIQPSPVVALNRAVAIAMRDGPEAGVAQIDRLLGGGELTEYYLAHSARGELCFRAGRFDEARESFRRALELAQQDAERRFLERRLAAISK